MNIITADKVYKEILDMPIKERERLFTVIANRGFEKDFYTLEEVFGDIKQWSFTIQEAAEYLEVAEVTVRRWAKKGLLVFHKIGKNFVFNAEDLKIFKKSYKNNVTIQQSSPP